MTMPVNATDRDGLTVAIDTAQGIAGHAESLIEMLKASRSGRDEVPPRLHEVVQILRDARAELFDLIKNYH